MKRSYLKWSGLCWRKRCHPEHPELSSTLNGILNQSATLKLAAVCNRTRKSILKSVRSIE